MAKEEAINIAVLNQLIINYCTSNPQETNALSLDSLFPDINVIKSSLNLKTPNPLILLDVISAVSMIIKKIEMQSFLEILQSKEVASFNSNKIHREYVAISSVDEISFLKMDDIMYCKADGKYTRFFMVNGSSCLSSKNLGDYENRVLDDSHFFRVHNSYIVNMRFVSRIDKKDGMSCELINGFNIPISGRKLEMFNKFIRIKS